MSGVNPPVGCVRLNSVFFVFLTTLLVLLTNGALCQGTPVGVSFLPRVIYDTLGREPSFVAAADLNGDGETDLIVTNSYFSNTIAVFLGKGDGTFKAAVTYDSGGGFPATVVPIDLNHDGKIDLVVANQSSCYPCSQDGVVAVLMGKGDGTFASAVTYDSGGLGFQNSGFGPAEIAVADLDHDGKVDIVVTNCGPSTSTTCGQGNGVLGILFGNGDGTFKPAKAHDIGWPSGAALELADVNGDGNVDALVAVAACSPLSNQCEQGFLGVMLGNGDGTFQPALAQTSVNWPASGLSTADLNDDGKLDVVIADCPRTKCRLISGGFVTVLMGKGDGTFQPGVNFGSGGAQPDGVAIADLNGDGFLDVVVANVVGDSVAVLLGNGTGSLRPAVVFPQGTEVTSVLARDFNHDGKPDIAYSILLAGLGVLINNTTPTSTTLISSLNPSIYGQKVTFSATVTNNGGVAPTGTVVFAYGTHTIGSATLSSGGVATLTRSILNAGSYPIVATYKGDSNNLSSTSSVLDQVINPATSKATLTSSPNPSGLGQAVTFTAKITSPTTVPKGSVSFQVGKTVLGTVQLSAGKAAFTTSSLPLGTSVVTVIYERNPNIKGSWASVKQTVQ